MAAHKQRRFSVVTLLPEVIEQYADASILKRASVKKLLAIKAVDLRRFGEGKHQKVDARPYGGGPGMVLQAEPILKAVKSLGKPKGRRVVLLMTPRGKQFTDADARSLARTYTDFVFISGRYEGIDARVGKILKAKEYSIGPYTLTGGELPALAMIDAVARQIPGVLGDAESLEHARTAPKDTYTRPESFVHAGKTYKVPTVLKEGNHAEIEKWRKG